MRQPEIYTDSGGSAARERETRRFTVTGPLFLPFYNLWAQDVYTQTGPFDLDPVGLDASSTSGSPVVLAPGLFVGMLEPVAGGRFRYDGAGTLEVEIPEGGRLFVLEGADPQVAWAAYNAEVLGTERAIDRGDFYDAVEYCTWVEQKAFAREQGLPNPQAALTETFVYNYLERLERLSFPKGKLTIDDGWAPRDGPGGRGDWEPVETRFPDLARVVRAIEDAGHVPGLWFAPGHLATSSRFAVAHPEALGPVQGGATEVNAAGEALHYALPTEALAAHYRDLFSSYVALGFRKFKLDIFYGPKDLMTALARLCFEAIKAADPRAEVENHIPDVFASRYADVVRTNDVLISKDRDWRGLASAHWEVCHRSSPDKVLNLDHVGGNDPDVGEAAFLEHWAMFPLELGHPVISLLPDRFSPTTVAKLHEGLATYDANRVLRRSRI